MSSAGSRPGGIAGGEHGHALPAAQAAPRARAHGRPGHPEPAPQARPGAGDPGLPAEPAGHLRRRPGDQEPVPVHAAGHRRRRALSHGAAGGRAAMQALPGLHRRDDRPAAPQPAGQRRHRPRPGLDAGGLGRADRGRALQRLRLAADLDHLRADTNQYQVILELKPEYQRDAAALSLLYVRSSSGALVPLDALARDQPGLGPLSVNHFGQLPVGDHLLQPAAGRSRWATPWPSRTGWPAAMLPATITTSFQGTAQAFQSSIAGPRAAARRRGAGHLHGAGHPLRELHPPAHDPLGPAVRRASAPWSRCCSSTRELSIYAFVGLIMLVGLVKKNGIMMVDFAIEAAAQRAASRRARPSTRRASCGSGRS